jgi:hypothetical protein
MLDGIQRKTEVMHPAISRLEDPLNLGKVPATII